ncbi:PDZ domain-containing protein [Albitalea terrae]|uniref:Probable periplasmic serine endoprotease DegP-like n=2 Tax=Piscinibacter terrae TaxID=2496871 RepID=A0A3N7HHW7_9BURK|nr:PDZ domain-containing protein [Albitalea terrae]
MLNTALSSTSGARVHRLSMAVAVAVALIAAAGMAPSTAHAQAGFGLPDFTVLVEKVGPAVVNIRTQEKGRPTGEGSGFIISADGYVVTNAHVVSGATEVTVSLPDKREFKAKIVGADDRTDVALVKVEATGLPTVKTGDVSKLKVGEWVLAIGSPFGLENTVTAGIVSAKQRETGQEVSFLQTDAAVNPGNSGGPLISLRGEVVGVNSQSLSRVGFGGVSFAIPIDEAMRVVDQLRASGHVIRGYLGILPVDVPRELAEEYKLGKDKARGAFVRQVVQGAPADKAGVQPGDVVLTVNGKAVDGAVDLRRTLGGLKPGTAVTLQINRQGKALTLTANLSELNDATAAAEGADKPAPGGKASAAAKNWGIEVTELTAADKQAARRNTGVKVAKVSDGAESVGVRVGDVIIGVGSFDVTDVKQFDGIVSHIDKKRPLPLHVLRGNFATFVPVPPSDN